MQDKIPGKDRLKRKETQLHMDAVKGGVGVVAEKRLSNQQHMGEKLRGLS